MHVKANSMLPIPRENAFSPSECELELTIVMPCLNEAETLATCIRKANQYLAQNDIRGEVLIADNGSTDGSQQIAQQMEARLIVVKERGYGSALMAGIVAANSQFIIMGDADDSYDFSDLQQFLLKLREGYDLVMGDRFSGGIKPGAMPFLHQYFGNPILSAIGRLFFHSSIEDFHCGLRGFKKTSIDKLGLSTTGMEFASEMVVKATLFNLSITEVPTILYPDGRSRPPHLRTWSDGWRHLRFLLLYSPNWLFLYPGLFLLILGLVLSAWLLPGPRMVNHIVFDINSLLYASLVVQIGFQAVNFAVFTRVFAVKEGLFPEGKNFNTAFKYITLEKGLFVGFASIIIGLAISIAALKYWELRSFGPLDTTISFRLIIPGVTLLMLGCQIILSSFFLSILGLKRLHR